ncbi:MAG TPA: DUF4349 domain-containing protein [Gaiellaceae bacterium]|nr:DUF4349 domain-containing protein [Gaiellaceae bacterium]
MSATDWNELDGYEALVSQLRANAPVAPESLRERVLEGAPAPRLRRSRRQRLFFVVVPVAVVLAVGAALVHGFVTSGSRPDVAGLVAGKPESHAVSSGKAYGPVRSKRSGVAHTQEKKLGKLGNSGKATLDQGGVFEEAAPASTVASAAALAGNAPRTIDRANPNSVTIPKNRLVHAVATLQVQVKSRSQLSARTNEASQIIGSFGGYAQSVRYQNSRGGFGEAVLQLRVPVQKAQAAIAKLSTLGRLLSQEVSTQDLQTKLTQQNSGIGSLRRAITVYVQALASGTLSATERVNIQIRLNNARHALAQLRHARTNTLESGATADISLLLTTRNQAVVVHHHHKSGRFDRFLGSAGGFLGLEGIIVLYALVVLSPIILLGALAWWILRERRRREERLLASA